MLPHLGCTHALLLQGPAGPFFRRFAEELRAAGISVTKVNFHAGDRLFFPGPEAIDYRGSLEGWPEFARELITSRGIDAVFVFGDCRPYHRAAATVARELGAAVWAFEEGYLRPDHITLERDGVNGNSAAPRDPELYLRLHSPGGGSPPVEATGPTFGLSAWYSTLNALAFTLLRNQYPEYTHHRPLEAHKHTFWWVRGAARKLVFSVVERKLTEKLTGEISGRYFIVPLQVHCDFQLAHSSYPDVITFIEEVVSTFAEHGRSKDHILFKHHPMDRPFREYGALLRRLARRHDLGDRLIYAHDLHLPTLLKHAKGTITINSTVGLSSLHHGTPVKVMGTAVYDLPGLTHQGDLADFLRSPGFVDTHLYEAFRAWLERTNQANGNFYRRLPGQHFGTGVRWFGTDDADPTHR